MDNNKKQPYLAPAVKVVEVKVEKGLTLSSPSSSQYGRNNVNSSWFDELTSTGSDNGMSYGRQNANDWIQD